MSRCGSSTSSTRLSSRWAKVSEAEDAQAQAPIGPTQQLPLSFTDAQADSVCPPSSCSSKQRGFVSGCAACLSTVQFICLITYATGQLPPVYSYKVPPFSRRSSTGHVELAKGGSAGLKVEARSLELQQQAVLEASRTIDTLSLQEPAVLLYYYQVVAADDGRAQDGGRQASCLVEGSADDSFNSSSMAEQRRGDIPGTQAAPGCRALAGVLRAAPDSLLIIK